MATSKNTGTASSSAPEPAALTSAVRIVLGDLNDNASRGVRRLRAYSASITALLPADPMTHPLLAIRPASRAAEDLQRYELRDALVAVRSLAESLDDIACGMGDDVDHAIAGLEKALGAARGAAA